MAHVTVPEGVPGILGPMKAYPETAKFLNGLAEHLLRANASLTPGEREMIAAYVSRGNECVFCSNVHAAVARHHLGPAAELMDRVLDGPARAPVSEKLKALLAIADKVRQGGRGVSAADVARARKEGADDRAIHDTVLIAAAFCMFNRYVDGLATAIPTDPTVYTASGARLGEYGYIGSTD
jgi:uncharacterized peroxidase-related enzyme